MSKPARREKSIEDRERSEPAARARDSFDGLPVEIAARAIAKAEICAALRVFKNSSGRTIEATLESFAALYVSTQIEVSAETREMFPCLKPRTLRRDWCAFDRGGAAALIPRYGNRRGDSIIERNPPMRELVIASILHNPKVNAPWMLDGIKARFPNDRIPSKSAIKEFIRNWKRENRSLFLRIADPDGWKSRDMLALGDAAAGITRVNQRWEIDGTRSDAFVWTEIESKTGKLQMIGVIDIASRKISAHLAPSESSQAVGDLLIKAFEALGVPDEIVSDRGAAFLSERTQRAMARLGIKWTAVRAYSGEKKPFIERGGMGSVLHGFFENVPGYSGHNPAEASAIRKRRSFAQRRGQNLAKLYRVELTAPELQALLDQWLEHVYGNRKHSKLGRTPNEVFAEADRRGQVRRVADERLLDLILGEDGVAVIGKKGLRTGNTFYWDDALVEHVGQTVQFVRTRDQGKLIVYTADAAPRFICIAVDPESAGIDREVLAIAAKQRQAAVMREGMKGLRALKRKHSPEKIFREILDRAIAKSAVELSPPAAGSEIATLPRRSKGIDAASSALAALDTLAEPLPHDKETLSAGAAAAAEIEHRREMRALELDDDEIDNLWIAIRRERRALTMREQKFLSRYGNTAESWASKFERTPEFQALTMRMSAA